MAVERVGQGGRRLVQAGQGRAEQGITRRELADALGVHYQTVGYLERGEYNPSLHLALRIAEFFGLPVEMVFSTRPFPRISDAGTPDAPAAAG